MTPIHLRWMTRPDMPAVHAIERRCFDNPMGAADFTDFMRKRNSIGIVAVAVNASNHTEILGFSLYLLHPGTVGLFTLAVDPAHRRQGIGRQMVEKLKNKLFKGGGANTCNQQRTRLMVAVRESNLEGLHFFKACGLVAVSVMRGAYGDTGEDAYAMRYCVNQDDECSLIQTTAEGQ